MEREERYRLPADFVQAVAPVARDGSSVYGLTGKSGLPLEHLQAVAERMGGITVAGHEDGDLRVTFTPYDAAHRVQWCMSVRKLAKHHGVDWPHLFVVEA